MAKLGTEHAITTFIAACGKAATERRAKQGRDQASMDAAADDANEIQNAFADATSAFRVVFHEYAKGLRRNHTKANVTHQHSMFVPRSYVATNHSNGRVYEGTHLLSLIVPLDKVVRHDDGYERSVYGAIRVIRCDQPSALVILGVSRDAENDGGKTDNIHAFSPQDVQRDPSSIEEWTDKAFDLLAEEFAGKAGLLDAQSSHIRTMTHLTTTRLPGLSTLAWPPTWLLLRRGA